VQVIDIPTSDLNPASFLHMVHVVDATRVSVTVGRVVDSAPAEINSFLDSEIGAVERIENTIRIGGTGSNGKEVAFQPCGVVIDIVELWTRFVPNPLP